VTSMGLGVLACKGSMLAPFLLVFAQLVAHSPEHKQEGTGFLFYFGTSVFEVKFTWP
jgi:hypothetical protein